MGLDRAENTGTIEAKHEGFRPVVEGQSMRYREIAIWVCLSLMSWGCTDDPQCNGAECGVVVLDDICMSSDDCPVGQDCVGSVCQLSGSCGQDSDCPLDHQCISGGCYLTDPPDLGRPDTRPPDLGSDPKDVGSDVDVEMGCGGCLQETSMGESVCLPGDLDAACGVGGAMCVDCGTGWACAEGVCEEIPSCDPSNCAGCCVGDMCEPGDVDSACGTAGLQCQDCGADSQCMGGQCVVPCNADSCVGCCNSQGDCVSGMEMSACGSGGETCASCGAGQECAEGACLDLSCAQTCGGCCSGTTCLAGDSVSACGDGGGACVDCGQGRLCDTGVCRVDPDSRWDLTLRWAAVSSTDSNGDSWDYFGGLPDPWVRFSTSFMSMDWEADSSTQSDTTIPFWLEVLIQDVKAAALLSYFEVEVWDGDVVGSNKMSGCFGSFREEYFDGTSFSVVCPQSGSLQEATIYFNLDRH